jgi:tRNA 2-selenouridine synthase
MNHRLSIRDFLDRLNQLPVVDVRSPSEYARGHIPGAFNIPLFSDEERAAIGIEYKKRNRERAILTGLNVVLPKMAALVDKALEIAQGSSLLLHCWRGGMRSENMALLFRASGIHCEILDGGYRSYRRYIRQLFAKPMKLIILGGFTGCGKTEMLNRLQQLGQQTIDLERIAHHKGSAFGGIGQEIQPSVEQFENNLFTQWRSMDPALPVWLEDESKAIGSVFIPDELYHQMKTSPVINMEMDFDLRVKRLEKEYATFPSNQLKDAVARIRKRLGDEKARSAFDAIDQSKFDNAITIILSYYDKTYSYALTRRDAQTIDTITFHSDNPRENARRILAFAEKHHLI